MRVPGATYRLQLNADLTFADALGLVLYLDRLGVSDVYTSPVFTARPGSRHSYDVIDPAQLNPELGGRDGFRRLAAALRERGMGLLLDIVPNHLVAEPENDWWAGVLAAGAASPFARYFDIDWAAGGGKLVLPVLRAPLDEVLQRGELRVGVDEQGPHVRYFDLRLPLASGVEADGDFDAAAAGDADALGALLDRQHYRLAYWRTGIAEVNYRRFFAVNELAGVRAEDEAVFTATHTLTLELAAAGDVSGLRIDHIDGLRDPLAYLERLQRALPGDGDGDFYLLVEKILSGDEALPESWPVAGTTGYDFLNTVNGLFVDAGGLQTLRETYASFTGDRLDLSATAREQKARVARELFPAELRRLAAALAELGNADGLALAEADAEAALVAVAAGFPVYRTYVDEAGGADADRAVVDLALTAAEGEAPAAALGLLRRVLLLELQLLDEQPGADRERRAEWLEFVLRWQQFTGPVTAKGVEDTALYRHIPLLSMNEVGVDAERPGVTDAAAFHDAMARRVAAWPHTLNATSTHDTKRGEDARVRIDALSGLAGEWAVAVQRWSEMNAMHGATVDGRRVPDANEEWLIYQALVGAWPFDDAELPSFRSRAAEYIVKAAREAKRHTNWLDPDTAYEAALVAFVEAVIPADGDNDFLADFLPFQRRVAKIGAVNSLAQTLLKVTAPGVPDLYQGSELWDLSFVDPDNRRPVDFAARLRILVELERASADKASARALLEGWEDGRIKLWLTWQALRFRRERGELFCDGDYVSLETSGAQSNHVVAFARRHEGNWAVAVAPRLVAGVMEDGDWPVGPHVWGNTALRLPNDAPVVWRSVLTGEDVAVSEEGALSLGAALADVPVALLAPRSEASD